MERVSRVIITDGKRILLGKRDNSRTNGAGQWNIIGGTTNDHGHESLRDAAFKEVLEETGLDLAQVEFLIENKFGRWLSYIFIAHVESDVELTEDLDEHTELKWFTPDEIEDMQSDIAFNHYQIIMACLEYM